MATGSFKGRSRVPFRSLSSLLREAMATYQFFFISAPSLILGFEN